MQTNPKMKIRSPGLSVMLGLYLASCASPALQESVVWPEVQGAWVEVEPMVAEGPADLVGSVGTAVASRDVVGLKAGWTLLAPYGEVWVRMQLEAGQLGPKGAEIARGLLGKFTLVVGRMQP